MSEPWFYSPGDHYVIEDISGFKRRYSKCQKISGGQTGNLIVARERWETQHPQDNVRGIVDEIAIDGAEARPRQRNEFMVVGTWVTAFAARGTNVITVDDTSGFNIYDQLYVMLDGGEPYYPVLIGVIGTTLTVWPPLPQSVGGPYSSTGMIGNIGDPIENLVLDLGPSDVTLVLGTDAEGTAIVTDQGAFIPVKA